VATSYSLRALAAISANAAAAASVVREPHSGRGTSVFLIASPRRLTGKTFLARLVYDFLRLDGGAAWAFDLDPGEGSLADEMPPLASRADINTTRGQMALFDRLVLDDGLGKVVDIDDALLGRFFTVMEEIGFLEEARRRAVEPVILYPADPHPTSVKVYAVLQRRFPRTLLVPVFNEAILKGRKVRDQFPFTRTAAVPIQIPVLPPALKAQAAKASFAEFHHQLPIEVPIGYAFELRSWTKRVFLEFREFELRLLMEKLRSSLSAPP
jgi:hypothetical protein